MKEIFKIFKNVKKSSSVDRANDNLNNDISIVYEEGMGEKLYFFLYFFFSKHGYEEHLLPFFNVFIKKS